jgi:putative RNA 2'-phosphotransferase
MKKKERTSLSRFLSLILRHKPEAIGITLDEHGWADVDELLEGMNRKRAITMEMLEEIVRTDEKQRYSWNEDKTLIRANQGHSVPVDVELSVVRPPKKLWHGSAEKYAASIEAQGLLPGSRLYVHLSSDIETAVKVGRRHGKPIVYRVDTEQMDRDGFLFYLSVNGVWLTKNVPPQYLERETDTGGDGH